MWLALFHAAFAADIRYVQASTLNLRADAAADAAVRKVLPINSEVDVLSVEGGFAKVRASGKEGWVAVDFLAPQQLTVEEAMSKSKISAEPADRLSWVQRAAAIRPDDAVLLELEAAYRSVGDQAAADQVSRERKWPRSLVLVAADGPPQLELSQGDNEPAGGVAEPVAPADFERRFEFSVNAKGWLLPDRGPAIEAQLGGSRLEWVSPCESGWGTVAFVAAGLPYDRVAIAFTREDPPPSWRKPTPTPSIPEDEARKAADERLSRLTSGKESETWVIPMPDGWFVRVARGDSPDPPETSKWQYVDLLVTAAGVKDHGLQDHQSMFGGPPEPIAVRDVNGDGEVDLVQRGACARMVTTLNGAEITATAGRCCD